MKSKKNKINKLGFVLLFSLLVSSILLATGLGISRIMVRQINLASLSRESQVAFFAADSGLECAMHWDVFQKFNLVDTPGGESQTIYCNGEIIKDGDKTLENNIPIPLHGSSASCDVGEPPSTNIINGDNTEGKKKSCFVFSLPLKAADGTRLATKACAFVVVDKSDPERLETKITSNGYNNCNLNASNILQRTLEMTLVNK